MVDVRVERREVPVDRSDSPEASRDVFEAAHGPTIAGYRDITGDRDRTEALDGALAALARPHGAGQHPMGWEYLLLTAPRAG